MAEYLRQFGRGHLQEPLLPGYDKDMRSAHVSDIVHSKFDGPKAFGSLLYELHAISPISSDPLDQIYGIMALGALNTSSITVDDKIDRWELFVQIFRRQPYCHKSNLQLDSVRGLYSRLVIDHLTSNFERCYAKALSEPQSLRFDIVIHDVTWSSLATEPSQSMSKIFEHMCEQLPKNSDAELRVGWYEILDDPHLLFCIDRNGTSQLLGFLYGEEHYNCCFVPVRIGEMDCTLSRDLRAMCHFSRRPVLHCSISESLCWGERGRHLAENPKSARARQLMGIIDQSYQKPACQTEINLKLYCEHCKDSGDVNELDCARTFSSAFSCPI